MASTSATLIRHPGALCLNTRGRVIGEVPSKWRAELTNYQIDYTAKSIHKRNQRPTSSHRMNKPHPKQVAHLHRLTNEPVCTVNTIINHGDPAAPRHSYMQSLMKEQFKLPKVCVLPRTTRFGCNKDKHVFASGIVPARGVVSSEKREPLLPACAKDTTLMMTSNSFQYVQRRRRIIPKVVEETIDILEPMPDKIPLGKPHSCYRTSRRLVSSAPTTTLQVSSFDGGAPPDYSRSITGRKRYWHPAIPGVSLNVPGYMQEF